VNWPSDPTLSAEWTLPCGHKIGHSFRATGRFTSLEDRLKFIEHGTKMLSYWAQARWQRHDCARVTPDNIYGLIPAAEFEALHREGSHEL
jgi:hypothetical protein